MIGTWFLVDSSFKAERIMKLYGQMAFYTIGISITILLLGLPHTNVDIIRCFMPFTLRPVWFGSAYIALLLLIPFLNYMPRSGGGRFMVIILFLLISVFSTITPKIWDNYICSFVWFCFVYLAMRQFKYTVQSLQINKWLVLLIGISLYAILAYCEYLDIDISKQYLDDYKSVPNFFISLCVFYFFTRVNIGTNKVVNWLAGSAFAVYIVHQTPNFYYILWNDIYQTPLWIDSDRYPLYLVSCVFFTYIWISLIDQIRKKLIEPLWLKSRLYVYLTGKIISCYGVP